MKPIKKIISDALSNTEEPTRAGRELNPEVQAFLKNEIQSQLRQFVEESILPEIRKAVAETLRAEIQKLHLSTANTNIQETEQLYQGELPLVLEEEILPLEQALAEVRGLEPALDTRPFLSIDQIRLGIDFGTTTTVVSLLVGDEKPQALPIGHQGELFMPSIVYFQQGGGPLSERALIGEDAEALSLSDPAHVIRSIKRCFGCGGENCSLQGGRIKEKFPWCNGEGKIQVTPTETLLPSEVAFFIIQEALSRAIHFIKEKYNTNVNMSNIGLASVNLGCGAKFNLFQRHVLLDNAHSLGFTDLTIKNVVEEPILAGLAFSRYVELSKTEGRSLIYDFGGGTLDIAVVDVIRKDNKPFVTVLSTSGDNWLGGDDIDQVVLDEFVRQIAMERNDEPENILKHLTTVDLIKLRNMAKTAKERLSSSDQFKDSLDLEQLGLTFPVLTRNEFETLLSNSGLIRRSFDALLKALKLAYALDVARERDLLDLPLIRQLRLEEAVRRVDRVILVGGVTKIPLVKHEIERLVGAEKIIEENVFDPISAVSLGAAYPREANHFSISSPPYGFYLEGAQADKTKCEYLLAPYSYLDFFKDIYNNSIPRVCISFDVIDTWHSVSLKGWEPFTEEVDVIREWGRLEPGNYQFYVGLDGSLTLINNHSRPLSLGTHRYTHPLQKSIRVQKEHRQAEANRYHKSLDDDYKSLMSEN